MISLESLSFAMVFGCATVAAWLMTYAVHSTVFIGGVWLAQRLRGTPRQHETLWKVALLTGFASATATVVTGFTPLSGRYETAALVEASWWIAPAASRPLRLLPIAVVAAWVIYAAAVLVKVMHATIDARKSLGTREPADASTRAMVRAVGASMALDYSGVVTISEAISSPIVLGQSEITFPRRVLTEFTPIEQRSIVAHELAHVIRHDPWWLMVAATIESIFFFQLLNRVARVRWQELSEYICDEMAVNAVSDRLALARSLARVAEWMPAMSPQFVAPAFAEQRSTLLHRVKQILEPDANHRSPSRALVPFLTIALIVLAVVGAPAFGPGSVRGWATPAFSWEGVVPPGNVIEVQGVMGSIHAIPTERDIVTVRATRRGRSTTPDIRFEVVTTSQGVTVCALYPTPLTRPPNRCVPGAVGQFSTRENDVQIEFIVAVPAGVGLRASSATGDVTTEALSGPVEAASSSGDIRVILSAATWKGAMTLTSKSGDVTVTLPRQANVAIDATTMTGSITSAFPIGVTAPSILRRILRRLTFHGSLGSHVRGEIGRSDRELVLRTLAGDIAIKAR